MPNLIDEYIVQDLVLLPESDHYSAEQGANDSELFILVDRDNLESSL